MSAFDHIDDIETRALYELVFAEPDRTLEMGERVLASASDPLAVLEVMREAAQNLLREAEQAPPEEPPERSADDLRTVVQSLDGRIAEARAAGATSAIFETWKRACDEESGAAVDEFRQRVGAQPVTPEELVAGLDAAGTDVSQFGHWMDRLYMMEEALPEKRLEDVRRLFARLLSRQANRAGTTALYMYVEALPRIGTTAALLEEIATSAVTIALEAQDRSLALQVLRRVVPPEVTTAGLSFALARLFAGMGERERVCEEVARAIRLGCSRDALRADPGIAQWPDLIE